MENELNKRIWLIIDRIINKIIEANQDTKVYPTDKYLILDAESEWFDFIKENIIDLLKENK